MKTPKLQEKEERDKRGCHSSISLPIPTLEEMRPSPDLILTGLRGHTMLRALEPLGELGPPQGSLQYRPLTLPWVWGRKQTFQSPREVDPGHVELAPCVPQPGSPEAGLNLSS
jgi:hypothetical protein